MSGSRKLARRCVLQALYQWQLSGESPQEVVRQFTEERGLGRADRDYFHDLFKSVCDHVDELDQSLTPFLDRPIEELEPVLRSVLWFAAEELSFRLEIPYRVVINEAVEQARSFAGEDGYKLVNAVLDHLAEVVRKTEWNRRTG